MARVFSNTAAFTTLTSDITNAVTTIPVGDTSGWPTPGAGDVGIGAMDHGDQTKVEIFSYTGKTGTSFTGVTRALDGTTAQAHATGARVRHIISAADIQEIGAHLADTTAAHNASAIAVSPTVNGADDVQEALTVLVIGRAEAHVATDQGTASTSFTDLATVGPAATVTIKASGLAFVSVFGALYNSGANPSLMGFAASGANVVAASTDRAVSAAGTATTRLGASFLLTGLAAGSTTFTAKYSTGGGTAGFFNRRISVLAL